MIKKSGLLLAIILVGLACGCGSTDARWGQPLGLVDGPIRVATYNIHHWEGDDQQKDIFRISNVMDSLYADIVFVQETDNNLTDNESYGRMERVEQVMDGSWATFDSEDEYTVHRNALFVSPEVEVISTTFTDISEAGRDPRAFIDATVEVRGARLRVIGAHLGLKLSERKRQVRTIAAALEEEPEDIHGTILGGDLNEWNPLARTFKPLKAHLRDTSSGRTFPANNPLLRLDRLWVSENSAVEHVEVVRSPLSARASDHLPLVAEIVF